MGTTKKKFRTESPTNPPLTPAQQTTLNLIRLPANERTTYNSTLRAQIQLELEKETVNLVEQIDEPLWVSKRQLQAVTSCEVLYEKQEGESFEWKIPMTRGQIFHKCVELSVHLSPARTAPELVDEAMTSIMNRGDGLASFLVDLTDIERAEIRSEVASLLQTYFDTFPPLQNSWNPTTELPRKVLLHKGKIVLQGRFDLTVGRPDELTAGRVLIELKTGRAVPHHLDDLRFYALLETLVVGVPPALLASFYVDAGTVQVEVVDEDLLRSAIQRTSSAVKRLLQLRLEEREPERRASGSCRWCPAATDCRPGQAWLEEANGSGVW